jgi:hypothetical protein
MTKRPNPWVGPSLQFLIGMFWLIYTISARITTSMMVNYLCTSWFWHVWCIWKCIQFATFWNKNYCDNYLSLNILKNQNCYGIFVASDKVELSKKFYSSLHIGDVWDYQNCEILRFWYFQGDSFKFFSGLRSTRGRFLSKTNAT